MPFPRPLLLSLGVATAGALVYACSSKGTTNPPPPPTYTISKVSGDSQIGSANSALGANLVVSVVDQNNNPATGLFVTWLAGTGGGTVMSGSSQVDANGHATMVRTLGPSAGFQKTLASFSGATGSPITFTSISQIGGAFQIAAASGTPQTDTVLATLPQPFVVTVTDYQHNPVSGVSVSFAVLTGGTGGSVTPTSAVTDASGHASTTLTLGSLSGSDLVAAQATGLVGTPVSFIGNATAGNAAQMSKSAGDSQTALISTTLPSPHTVIIKDGHGNVVGGFKVSWAVGTGGGSISDTAPVSDGSGVASVSRTLGATLGTQTDTAKSTLSGSPIVFVSIGDSIAHTAGVTVGPGISYSPTSVTIAAGGTVTWTWASGSIAHNVEWLTGPGTLPASSAVQTTGTYQVTFTTPGTYTYDCVIHGAAMSGSVIVK